MNLPKHPAVPYVAGFAVFLGFLALGDRLPVLAGLVARVVVTALVLVLVARRVIELKPRQVRAGLLFGAAVFLIWIAPDFVWPGYRRHWLFENPLTGGIPPAAEPAASGALFLALRTLQAAALVPVIEELFWRGWLLRWLVNPDFEKVPPGTYTPASFWITAVLFASEHGPYWDVGLIAGAAYNWWMLRTRSLADCIFAHAVTNALLAAYVIGWRKFEYWP
jgi:CAAX prenyl protease-like protein